MKFLDGEKCLKFLAVFQKCWPVLVSANIMKEFYKRFQLVYTKILNSELAPFIVFSVPKL